MDANDENLDPESGKRRALNSVVLVGITGDDAATCLCRWKESASLLLFIPGPFLFLFFWLLLLLLL